MHHHNSHSARKLEDPFQKKERLTTSDEIVNRLKWDIRYPHEQFLITYLDRFLGLMDTTLEAFLEADFVDKIPYHRIYFFKLNGHIVWDREKRIDLISSGKAMKYVEYSKEEKQWIAEEKKTEEKKEPKQNDELIVFNSKKKRHYYVQYVPKDSIEEFMCKYNDRDICLLKPTHISQKGGYYHINSSMYEKTLKVWEKSIKNKDTFFMEEYRTPIFRLYVDLDFKTTNGKPMDFLGEGYIQLIQEFTSDFFREKTQEKFHSLVSSRVIITECHGEWNDAVTKAANFKSGYRLYFPTIYVDEEILREYITQLGHVLKEKKKRYFAMPEDWDWKDIVDVEQVGHNRARMFGSVKWRRGNNLGRKYSFLGFFDSDSSLNTKVTGILQEHKIPFLQLTSVRFEGKTHLSNSTDVQILVVSSTYVRESTFPIADLRKNHLQEAGFTFES